MASFDTARARVIEITGANNRKTYTPEDDPPTNAEIAKAIPNIERDVSETVAWSMELHRKLGGIGAAIWTLVVLYVLLEVVIPLVFWIWALSSESPY